MMKLYKIINELEQHGKIVITHNGKPKAILADISHYEDLEKTAHALVSFDPEKLLELLNQRESSIAMGEYVEADQFFKEMDQYIDELGPSK